MCHCATRYLAFAMAGGARSPGNFRDLAASVTRMATLASGGHIDVACVAAEIVQLKRLWAGTMEPDRLASLLGIEAAAAIDPFDRVQLAEAIRVCRARMRSIASQLNRDRTGR